MQSKQKNRIKRHRRVRAKVSGTSSRPRLSVFVSNRHMFLQLIDDDTQKTVASASTLELGKAKVKEKARSVAKLLADKAAKLGIKQAVYDRGGYKYHGNVKKIAETVRESGIKI